MGADGWPFQKRPGTTILRKASFKCVGACEEVLHERFVLTDTAGGLVTAQRPILTRTPRT
eukprot:4251518-Pyramimonas_sp.AAC.1